jgi:hypothetical protein
MVMDATKPAPPRAYPTVDTRSARFGLPAELSCLVVRVQPGRAMSEAVNDHLARGYDIVNVDDGWVLLRKVDERIALSTLDAAAGACGW